MFRLRNVELHFFLLLCISNIIQKPITFGTAFSWGVQKISTSTGGRGHGQVLISALEAHPRNRSTSASSQTNKGLGVTSSLISQLAIIALKLRLPDKSSTVNCDVTASSSDVLMKGEVGPVTVSGKRWSSRLGLTCRAIKATVQTCNLDIASILSKRKLVLTTPALGDALIALDDNDFGNFITHPLVKPPAPIDSSSDGVIRLMKEGVTIDTNHKGGAVLFEATFEGNVWICALTRGQSGGAVIDVSPKKGKGDESKEILSQKISKSLTTFFNELVFELDGTYLSFNDMKVTEKGKNPSVMFSLSIKVRKFPSPGLEF